MSDDKTGRFLGLPYDWRRPTWQRIKRGVWNPADSNVFTPKSFGWGFGINVHALLRRLRVIRPH